MYATLFWKVKKAGNPVEAKKVNDKMAVLLRGRGKKLLRVGERILPIADLADFNKLVLALQQIAANQKKHFEFIIFLLEDNNLVHGGPVSPQDDPSISPIIS